MKVVLAGATGTLGGELVPRLLAAGHSVLGLTRSPARRACWRTPASRRGWST
ncbi:NAD-dependent epimerase/dehydratase family protein [Nonomuraea antimicrobica]